LFLNHRATARVYLLECRAGGSVRRREGDPGLEHLSNETCGGPGGC